jgi:prepilin-type processing-associated H-X9-DG protein
MVDGSSNTLMLGEVDGGRESDIKAAEGAWMRVGCIPTWQGLPLKGMSTYHPATFSSQHPAGVNFCFADGSVRLLKRGRSYIDWWNWELANLFPNNYPPDWWVLQELGGMRDGGIRDTAALIDEACRDHAMKPLLWWLLAAFLLLLAGCGGSKTTELSNPTSPGEIRTQEVSEADAAKVRAANQHTLVQRPFPKRW